MDGEQEDGVPRDADVSASPPPAAAQVASLASSRSSIATAVQSPASESGSSIFRFHPHHQQQHPSELKKKVAATPQATTPRNLVFPEPSDAQSKLPIAQEVAFNDLRDRHNGNGNGDTNQEVQRHMKVPPSAKKYLIPRIGDEGNGDDDGDDSVAANNHQQQHREFKKKVTPRATTPRNLVFPEPGDAHKELSIAQELPYTDLRDNHSGDADQEVHRRTKVLPSAKKYLSPRTGENGDDLDDGNSLAATDEHHHHSHHHHHKRPQTATSSVTPRSLHEKLAFYASRSAQSVRHSLRSVRQIYRHLSFQQKSAFVLILAGMLSESATPAPRYNVPIGIGVFMTLTSRFDHHMVVSGLCLAILIDFAWLLRPQEGSFNGFFQVKYDNLMHASLAICTLVKVWLVFSTYFDLGPEPPPLPSPTSAPEDPSVEPQQPPPTRPHHPVWHHIKFFFPRKTLPRSSHLSFEVLMRTLALIWIHGLCGIALFVLGILSAMFYAGRVQFRSMAFGAPLHFMMLFRSATTLASYFVATQHMNYNACLKVFGCHKLVEYDDDGGSDIVLKYNKRWLQRVQRAKTLDTVVGVYFLLVFYAAFHSGQFFAGSGLTAVLVITALIVLVLDFWTPLLLMVVAKCGTVLHAHHKRGTVDVDPYYPNQLEWEEEEENDKNSGDDDEDSSSSDDGSSSSGSSSSSGESSSYSSSWSSSGSRSSSGGGYSTTDSRIRRRRHRRQQKETNKHLKKRSSSRKPLLRTENSLPIINADEIHSGRGRPSAVGAGQLRPNSINSSRASESSSGGGVWVRHWHEASGRSFLVHSVTGESVWEIVSVQKTTGNSSSMHRFPSSSAISVQSPRTAAGYPRSSGSSSAPRQPSNTGIISSPPVLVVPGSPPTSDSEIVVTSVLSPRGGGGGGGGSARLSARRYASSLHIAPLASERGAELLPKAPTDSDEPSELLLTPDEFLHLWGALPDSGSFICRVSKIPSPPDLARHLRRNRFLISSDGLNNVNLRTVHFYAAVIGASPHDSSVPQFFLGEFVFDSLSLKLYAKFRCSQKDAIVPCVKKLQLKDIVGSYAPCD